MLRWIIRWLWRRDSESASCVCIDLAHTMSDKDLRNMADYFKAVIESRLTTADTPVDRQEKK